MMTTPDLEGAFSYQDFPAIRRMYELSIAEVKIFIYVDYIYT